MVLELKTREWHSSNVMPCVARSSSFVNDHSTKQVFDMTGIILRYLIFVPILLFYGEQV